MWLPDASALDDLPDDVRAAVSLCLVGGEQTRPDVDHHVAYPAVLEPLPAVRPIPAFRAAVRRLER